MRALCFPTFGALRLVALVLLLGLVPPLVSVASIQEVAVVPSEPSMCDPIGFRAAGCFSNGCWHYDGYDVTLLPTDGPFTTYRMRIFCHREESQVCPMVIVPYCVSHEVGKLLPGLYSLLVVEVDSRDSSRVYDQRGIRFAVSDSCGPVSPCVIPRFTPAEHGCNATVFPGGPGALTVALTNAVPIAGAEMVVDGFRQFRDTICEPGVRCGFMIRVVRVEPVMRAAGMGVEWTFNGEELHFMLHPLSPANDVYDVEIIEPGNGPIARIWIELVFDSAAWIPQIPDLDFTVTLIPVAFADENGHSIPACPTFAPIMGTVCIRNAEKCDVNGDGRADVVDIVRMIHCIMCPIPEGCCSPEEIARADCNGDNVLNVADVVCCIRYILDSFCRWCETEQVGNPEVSSELAAIGLSNDVSWESDNRVVVPITFSSPVDAGGIEGRIQYDPTVLSLDNVTLSEEFAGSELFFSVSDGVLSFMVVAMGDTPLPSGENLLGEVSFVCGTGEAQKTELVLEGAASADREGNRLGVVLSEDRVVIETPSAPSIRLASRPNPFHSSADVSLSIGFGQKVSLAVFDVTGSLVRTLHRGNLPAGTYTFSWGGRNNEGLEVRTGIYFLRFEGEGSSLTRKLVLLRD